MMRTAMKPTSSAYSTAVAPVSSRRRRCWKVNPRVDSVAMSYVMVISPLCYAGPTPARWW